MFLFYFFTLVNKQRDFPSFHGQVSDHLPSRSSSYPTTLNGVVVEKEGDVINQLLIASEKLSSAAASPSSPQLQKSGGGLRQLSSFTGGGGGNKNTTRGEEEVKDKR